jgi:hypothetical protein
MIKLFARAVVVSIVAGLALAVLLLSLAPRVAPVIDTVPQAARSTVPAPSPMPTNLVPIAEKILVLHVRI